MPEPLKMSVCPYNNTHKIATFKLPGHILKCSKNYSGPPLVKCIYNGTHLVRPSEMQDHLATCRDRHLFHICDYERTIRETPKCDP